MTKRKKDSEKLTRGVVIEIPNDINYELELELAGLKRDGFPKTKHNLILDLLRTALNLENNENI